MIWVLSQFSKWLIIEGSLEVTFPTIWTRERQRWEESEKKVRRESQKKADQRRESQKKEMQVPEKVRKSRNTVFFQMIRGSGGSKSRLAKAAGAEPAGQMRDEKLHAVVARSTFGSKKRQKLTSPDHFWKFRCRKSARSCGARHVWK